MTLALDNASVIRGGRAILDAVTLDCRPAEFTAFCGPNGAGKTTALRVMAGLLRADRGGATLDGTAVARLPASNLARGRGFVAQAATLSFPFRVHEVVEMGRTPHFGTATPTEDIEAVTAAMSLLDLGAMAERDYLTLSGGERQRVMIARALAQVWYPPQDGTRWLLLDEPNSALDLKYQLRLMALLEELAGKGWGVIAVLHDLELVRRHASRAVMFKNGMCVVDGPPRETLSPETVQGIFDLETPYAY